MTDWGPHLPALQVILPLLTAPLIIALQRPRLAWAVATITSVFTFAIAVALTRGVLDGQQYNYLMGSWPAPYGIELQVDSFSAIVLLIISAASSLALLGARDSLDDDIENHRQPLFYSAWLLVLAGLCGMTVAADAFNIFVFMEISSLASYILISGGSDRRALPAVFNYLIMGTLGATFYLIGIGLLYMMTGTLNLADMEQRIHEVSDLKPILVAAGFITIGLALKAAVFPLHGWLPGAYTFAPHAVTVFLAACSTKVALYLLLRFDFVVFQPNLSGHDIQFAYFLMPLGVLAIIIGSLVALFEQNLKRLLAYSSIAQIGYILLGASLVSSAGLTASIVHLFNHALAKGTLFLAISCLAIRCGGTLINNINGAARTMPWSFGALVVGGLSLIGMPGTAGFISKWYLISAALAHGGIGIALTAVILLSSLMAVVYIWRIVEAAYFREPEIAATAPQEAPLLLLTATWMAALLNIYFGLMPELPITLSMSASELLLEHLP
jgi:multicomponent Na+:H+ antiporter subunit D